MVKHLLKREWRLLVHDVYIPQANGNFGKILKIVEHFGKLLKTLFFFGKFRIIISKVGGKL